MDDAPKTRVNDTWQTARVGDILKIRNGYAVKSSDYCKDGVPLIRQSDINGDVIDISAAKRVPTRVMEECEGYLVREGDLLIGMSGSLGKIGRYPHKQPAVQNQRTGLLLLKPGFSAGFAKLVLKFVEPQIIAEGKGVAVQNVSAKEIEACTFPLPPPKERDRIVAELEKQFTRLDAGVSSLKRVQAALKRCRASVVKAACEGRLVAAEAELARKENRSYESADVLLQRILRERREKWNGKRKHKELVALEGIDLPQFPKGWAYAKVEQLGNVQLGRQRSPKNVSKNFPTKYIRAANITEQGIDVLDVLEMEFNPEERERFALREGDVVLSEASGSASQVGKPAIWHNELPLCCFQNTVIRFRPSILDARYALVVFRHFYVNKVFAKIAGGVGINHLGADKFSAIPFPIAPLAEQQRIVAEAERRLSVVEELEAVVSANLRRATRLRQSILQHVFAR
jgi:type I restriction enzyme S subunit